MCVCVYSYSVCIYIYTFIDIYTYIPIYIYNMEGLEIVFSVVQTPVLWPCPLHPGPWSNNPPLFHLRHVLGL